MAVLSRDAATRAALVSTSFFVQIPRMQAAAQSDRISVEDFLAAEGPSGVRHEYPGGQVHAMAGETREQNRISLNLTMPLSAVYEGV